MTMSELLEQRGRDLVFRNPWRIPGSPDLKGFRPFLVVDVTTRQYSWWLTQHCKLCVAYDGMRYSSS